MKVLHVESGRYLYGGAQQVVYLVEQLAVRGVDSVLVCPLGAEVGRALVNRCQVHEVRFSGDLDLGFVTRLKTIIERENPDIVHLHSRRGADTLGAIAAKLAGVPCVLSRRVDNPEPRWLVPLKYALYDRVITISEGIEKVLRACGVPPGKISCVRSAVDFARFNQAPDRAWFEQSFALPEHSRVIAVIAQLIPRKGHRYLFAALPSLLEKHRDLQVLVLGQGPLADALAHQAAEFGGRVHMAGFRDDLPRILPNLTAVVHPAEMEGLGVSLIQAAAAGVPIVASRAGGIPEVVRHERNGLLVDPGDVVSLREAVDRLLSAPDLARRLGDAGKVLAEQEFSTAVMAAGNLAVYRQLLGGP